MPTIDKPQTAPPPEDSTAAFQDEFFGSCSSGFCSDRQASANSPKQGDCSGGGSKTGGGCSGGSCSKGDMQSAMNNMPGLNVLAGLGKVIGRLFS